MDSFNAGAFDPRRGAGQRSKKTAIRLLLCCLSLALCLTAFTNAQTDTGATAVLPHGIYWLMSTGNDSGLATGIAPAYVDGATLRYRWQNLEDSDGHFLWSMLDRDLATVSAAGKKAQILIAVGNTTPCWVKNGGAAVYADYAAFDSNCAANPAEQFQKADTSAANVVPLPWDPSYQAMWGAFISSLAAHINATNQMGTIAGVVVSGIARVTSEINLPNPDDTAGWIAVNYTRQAVRDSYSLFLNDWATSFPNVGLSTRYTYGSFPSNFQPAGCPSVDHLIPRELNDIAFAAYPALSIMGYNGINSSTSTNMPGNLLQQMCGMEVPSGSLWTDCENPAESCQLGADYNTFQGPSFTPYVSYEGLQEDYAVGDGNFGQLWQTASNSFSRLLFIEVYPSDFSAGNVAALTAAHNALTNDSLIAPSATPTTTIIPTPSPTPVTGQTSLSVSPTSLTFRSQSVGTTSRPKTVTLQNTGTVAATINSVSITGANVTDFAVASSTCNGILDPGLKCTTSIIFKPTLKGSRRATLTISDSPDANSPYSVGLGGKGT
jgi:hypothetical protein